MFYFLNIKFLVAISEGNIAVIVTPTFFKFLLRRGNFESFRNAFINFYTARLIPLDCKLDPSNKLEKQFLKFSRK